MRVVNFSEVRNCLKNVIDRFNSLMETVHLLRFPANAAHLTRSIEQFRQGKIAPRDLLDDE